MEERKINVKKERIKKNEREISKLKEERKQLKIARNTIAVAALLTTTLGSFMYRTSPAEGAVFYISGGNNTEIEYTDIETETQLIETKNGRMITKEGAKKVYHTKAETENGYKNISVTLPQIVSKTEANSLYSEEVLLDNDEKIYVRTVPNSDKALSAAITSAVGIVTLIGDFYYIGNRINETNNYESRLKIKNRKLKRAIRRTKDS